MKSILIYGGSFDPPHLGHLNTALNIQDYFHFQRVFFLPCKNPVLKNKTQASAIDRLNMLKLMLSDYPEFSISTIELDRDTPSYMVETLRNFRDNICHECSITLFLGMDAFLSLPQWHDWHKIPALCNILVIKRPGISEKKFPKLLMDLFNNQWAHPLDLLNNAYGKLALFDAGDYTISSTDLRKKIHLNKDISDSLTKNVDDYIKHHGLYQ